MRAATALIVLFSVLSSPIASAVGWDCCHRLVEHQLPLCPDQAHAHLHVHRMNHVHMVMQDSEASVARIPRDNQLRDGHLSCGGAACPSAEPMQAFTASVLANPLQIPSHSIATMVSGFLTIAGPHRPPGECRIAVSSSHSAARPLRI
jgi:hypothetical protein